ncbi:MAG: M48 family metalloprotease, partial [Proteobacteria bacterium]|nr:M48 family metalloprotease [Pseudomonadota bacterium]
RANRVPELAALLAGVIVMATSDGQHGQAAIAASQGLALENRLRFSRSNEAEADRIGQDTMFNAGFDPEHMSSLFERLIAINRFGRRPPEFLLSHPVTESRIADARGRAIRYPSRSYSQSLEYQIIRARVIGHYATDKESLVANSERALQISRDEISRDASRYGLAVAYFEDEQYGRALETLAPLLEKEPNRISYAVTQAEFYTAQNEPGRSLNYLRRHLEINPDNHPLTMAYVDALVESRAYSEAAALMERHSKNRPNDHHLWYLLAEVQGQAGNISKVHQARAEYFVLLADLGKAREQLKYALRIETDNGAAPAEEARLRQKIRELEQRMSG